MKSARIPSLDGVGGTRREFLEVALGGFCGCVMSPLGLAAGGATAVDDGPVIDIHQHTEYHGRTAAQLLAHQRAMGIRYTVLLPAGSPQDRPSTHGGRSNGLAARCGGNATVETFAKEHPDEFFFGANEVPDLPGARAVMEQQLARGARILAEQKFSVACDGPHIELVASIAKHFDVPVLLHFQVGEYNLGFENFHRVLERFPTVNFIGHAQTWWSNVDEYADPKNLYPTTGVTPGGLTDRLLADYPNMFGDLSAGSGLNFLLRDEGHAAWFLERHQDKLLYGSDCADVIGRGPGCQGAQTLGNLRRLVTDPKVRHKLLFANAQRVLRLPVKAPPSVLPN